MAHQGPTIEERFATALNAPAPEQHQKDAAVTIKQSVVELAEDIEAFVPEGRWKSLALTSLEESLMWANKAIFNEKQ